LGRTMYTFRQGHDGRSQGGVVTTEAIGQKEQVDPPP
jgi:hypothetical protein